MIGLAILAVATATPIAPDPAVAEITQLQRQWGQAFVTGDFAFIERIVAPGFRLVVAQPDGTFSIGSRAEWMKNARAFKTHAFAVETVDVNRVGDTAVSSARGSWTVARRPDETPRATQFFVTDTWVRNNGQWQVIHRYSHRLPQATWPPPSKVERGR